MLHSIPIPVLMIMPSHWEMAEGTQKREQKVILGVKISDFLQREYEYRDKVASIIESNTSDEEKVKKIFDWVCKNITPLQEGQSHQDDHLLNLKNARKRLFLPHASSESMEELFAKTKFLGQL